MWWKLYWGLLPSTLTLKDLPRLLVLPLVDVVGDAVLVRAHKGPVVILDILLQQPSPGEASDCLPSDVSPLHKANVNTAHIDVRQRPGKRLEWSLSVEYGTLTQVIYLAYPLAISGS